MRYRHVLIDPIIDNNPVTLQILGICSAVAVTRSMWPAFVMAISVTAVLMFSNTAISMLRGIMPRSVRLVLEVTLIASAVIVADEALKAYAPETSKTLSVFVGLIITNCIVLGRAESYALNNNVRLSFLDGLGNGIGYGLLLLSVAAVREFFGSGTLMDQPIFAQATESAVFVANEFMALPASAFFIIGFIIWALRSWKPQQVEVREFDTGDED
jgi:Na+-transporting NADH:ubiquinone oxidoreductase subunit D